MKKIEGVFVSNTVVVRAFNPEFWMEYNAGVFPTREEALRYIRNSKNKNPKVSYKIESFNSYRIPSGHYESEKQLEE